MTRKTPLDLHAVRADPDLSADDDVDEDAGVDPYDDDFGPQPDQPPRRRLRPVAALDEPAYSTWPNASPGPRPRPAWVITAAAAVDADLGVLKTGKEADVHLVRRAVPDTDGVLMAAKRYRPADRRLFHRDAGYLEGRRVRRSRETRAMARRTEFGREILAGQWASAEFAALSRLWQAGAPVPYPVQLLGTEVMLEFIGTDDGTAAPRLMQVRPTAAEAEDLFDQVRAAMMLMCREGWAHGDLSPYNLLVDRGRLVVIDLPQIVDIVTNPRGQEFLRRDCVNVCGWFATKGCRSADVDELFGDLIAEAVSRW
ncbi:MAG: RIO1 family regulatory kinase/ATPase [bacterium]